MATTNAALTDYIAQLSSRERAEFDRIERVVKGIAPDAELVMSYGMPTFTHNRKILLHFGVFKNHLSLFPGASPIAELSSELKHFTTSKGTIQFTADKPIPDQLLVEIVSRCFKRAKESV